MAEWETNQNDDFDALRVTLTLGNGQLADLSGLAVGAVRWHIRNRATGVISSQDSTTIDTDENGNVSGATLSTAGLVGVAGTFEIIIRVTFTGGAQKSWPLQDESPYLWTILTAFA